MLEREGGAAWGQHFACGNAVCFNSFPFVESHLERLVMLESPQTEGICNFRPNIFSDIVKVSSLRTESKSKKREIWRLEVRSWANPKFN